MTIILDNYPPSTLQGVELGGRKNPRMIVGENPKNLFGPFLTSKGYFDFWGLFEITSENAP